MKYLKQFLIILIVTQVGEIIKNLIPLSIPTSIYGLILMFVLLCLKVVKVSDVEDAGNFLVTIMPIMFIPGAVGVIQHWHLMAKLLAPLLISGIIITIIVMLVTGKVTERIIVGGEHE